MIKIRKLETIEEVALIQPLERVVWGMEPIPAHQTYTAVTNGGLLLGAFIEDEIIGFSYSFPGYLNGETYLCSHMLGIHPNYQTRGIGKLLKEKQSEWARDMGYSLMIWTFDPLESRNAYLNFSKLKGICHVYLENCYGEMKDGLNQGLPSDRLRLEWWIKSERVLGDWRPTISIYKQPFTLSQSQAGNAEVTFNFDEINDDDAGFEIPVPTNFQAIKKEEPALAIAWRLAIREVFQLLFQKGYAVVNLRKSDDEVYYYQFIKKETIPLQQKERGDLL